MVAHTKNIYSCIDGKARFHLFHTGSTAVLTSLVDPMEVGGPELHGSASPIENFISPGAVETPQVPHGESTVPSTAIRATEEKKNLQNT